MNQQRFQLLERLFHEALALPESERAAFVRAQAGPDAALCRELEALLDSEGHAETHFEGVIGGVAASLPDGDVGLHLGPYTLVREIGRGGMGVVYQAVRTDGEFVQSVAVKLVRPGLHTDLVLQRFRTERQILATLQHPNIAQLLDGGTAPDGRPYFVMEYIEGGRPLLDYCRQSQLSETERLELFRAVCAAVDYAHRRGVIHRDIKPANILVSAEGIPKLLDFGIAKTPLARLVAGSATVTGARMLTPDYASPEQIRGERVTPASDIYSLGVVLRQLVGGNDEMNGIVRRALDPEPGKRYASAAELSEAVRLYIQPAASRPRWSAVGAILAVLLLASTAAHWYRAVRQDPANYTPTDPRLLEMRLRAADLLRQDVRGQQWPAGGIPSHFEEAIRLLETATAQEPKFAGAWSLLALAYELAADIDWRRAGEWIPKAKSAAGKAIRVNPEQADAYAVLGGIALYTDWDFASAERLLKRAVDLDGSNDHYLRDYADLLRITGRSEQARVEVDRALAIRLEAPRALVQRALLLYDLDRCQESDAASDRALRVLPGYAQAVWLKGLCAEAKGDLAGAEHLFRQVLATAPQDSRALPALGHTLARASTDRRAEAFEVLKQLEDLRRQGKRVEYSLALVHTGLGDVPAALYWLEQAYATRDVSLIYMNVERRLKPLQREPRFQELLRQLRLRR